MQSMMTSHINANIAFIHNFVFIQSSVDFRASCFCHQKAVDFAFMCSVCLSLTCDTNSVCLTCGTPANTGNIR